MIHILLSTYNGARYLREQLDSIVAQTYTDWRLYIRDDGSTDSTRAIVDEYVTAHPQRIFVDESDPTPLGACRSFEYLLAQHGMADYFAFSDQDDVWRADKLALSMEAIRGAEKEHQGKPLVVHTDLQVVDSQLQEIAPSFWKYSNIHPQLVDYRLPYLAICNSVTGCAMLFNRAARSCALPIPSTAYMHDAWIALCTAAKGGKVLPLTATPIAYRQHQSNVLGAVQYSFLHKSWQQRRADAKRSYMMAHPLVFASYLQFLFWKMIYFIHRQCS